MDRISAVATGSIAIGVIVLGLKYAAFVLTGSVALYSDALESTINIATAVAALIAVRLSSAPPDENHPFGHHKAEYISAVIEGVLIVVAAIAILHAAYRGFMAPNVLAAPIEGLAVNGAASAINAVWCLVLFRYGRKWRSPALVADAQHLWTDVVTSVGVFVGVGLVALTGWLLLDPALAALVALNVVWSGWKLIRESIGGLMDEAVPAEVLSLVKRTISASADPALEAHDVRTRRAGRATFIDFHLVVPGTMMVSESHAICDRLEDSLRKALPDAVVSIHVEPEEKAKNPGGVPVV